MIGGYFVVPATPAGAADRHKTVGKTVAELS
jgi:hypothetical protein